jgi:hypothetical protein
MQFARLVNEYYHACVLPVNLTSNPAVAWIFQAIF